MSDYKLKNICDFDLAQTLECGQCFHFVKLDENDYVLTAKGRLLHVRSRRIQLHSMTRKRMNM